MENINDENNINNNTGDTNNGDELTDGTNTGDELTNEPTEELTDEFTDEFEATSEPFEPLGSYDPPPFAGGATPPPPFGGADVEDRLVRDPETFFGGVLSGIANRYGWDTSLTRLGFVVALLMSGGTAILAYLLAWMIIPRARFWPPVVRKRVRAFSGRDIGLALIGVALLVVIGVGAGRAASVIVPLVLVGGGVWMLLQNPREQIAAVGVDPVASPSNAAFTSTGAAVSDAPSAPWTTPQMPTSVPQPVEPRSRRRKFAVAGGLIGVLLLIPALIIGGIVAAIAFGDLEIDASQTFTPDSIEDLPANLGTSDGELILDLRNVDFSDVDVSEPVELNIAQNVGRIEVILGPDVPVEVVAEVELGDVDVLGRSSDGINPEVSVLDEDALLVLDLDLDLGEIVVNQG